MNKKVQNVLNKARTYLSGLDTDQQVMEAVKKIAYHPNQNEYIDYVEDVLVWEKVTNTFECEEFLEEIEYYPEFEKEFLEDSIVDDTLTLDELIEKLQAIKTADPARGKHPVYIYAVLDVPSEEPLCIDSIDDSISDRIDINV